ncbi:MAG: transporter substrate-binding domain-containing protein [Proteobacteria bacterium]|nr:transporter substrate-binding domain-containing protein [Pseudomonadota bacterium]
MVIKQRKKSIRKIGAAIFLILVLSGASFSVLAASLNIVVFNVAPFIVSKEGQEPTGGVIEYYKQFILPKLAEGANWKIANVARSIVELKSKSSQMIPLLIRTKERERFLLFADTAYVHFDPTVVVLEKSPLKKVEAQSDLYGLTIGWSLNGVYPGFLKHAQIRISESTMLDWETSNMKLLAAERLDAVYFSSSATALYFAKSINVPVRIIALPTPHIKLYAAFSLGQENLRDRYNAIARQAFAEHDFDTFMKEYVSRIKVPSSGFESLSR